MATQGAKPSHTDIASLESAFSSDPSSDAYQPLAEAYLALGRFMEAMVVCKKGVKAHPSDPSARVLLARVYADQGKDRKAAEELKAALELDGDHAEANRMLGLALLAQGENDAGMGHLEKAAAAAPDDPAVREACAKWGVEVQAPEPEPEPEPEPPPAEAPAAAPSPDAGAAGPGAPLSVPQAPGAPDPQTAQPAQTASAPAQPGAPVAPPPPAAPIAPAQPPAPAQQPAMPPPGAAAPPPAFTPPPPMDSDEDLGDFDVDIPEGPRRGPMITMVVLAAGAVLMLGWWGMSVRSAERLRQADNLLADAQLLLGQGSYDNYLEVARLADESLNFQPRGDYAATAHAFLAYVNVLRWGEHLEGEAFQESARRHLEAAEAGGSTGSVLVAARAYYDFFDGRVQDGIDSLKSVVDDGATAAVLTSGLGHMYLWTGDFAEANRYLGRAQQQAPRDPRIYVALGELARRQDNPLRAANYYRQALTFDEDHVDALLGRALIVLDSHLLDDELAEPLIEQILEVPEGQLSPRQLAMARFARAQLLFAQDKATEANEEQEQALLVQPNNPDIHVMIGRRHFREGRHHEAADSIRRAIEFEPNRAGFHVELARVLMGTPGREGAREAVQAIERARQAFPENPSLLVLLGDAHDAAGDRADALRAYREANEMREGGMAEAHFALGSIHRREREFDEARESLEKAQDAYRRRADSRGQARALVELARIQMQEGDLGTAQETLVRAAEVDGTFPDTYYFLGRILSTNRRERATARRMLEGYLERDPGGEFSDPAQALLRRL